jgi:hypothetical protein
MLETFSHYARDFKNPFSFSHLSLFTLVGVVKNHFHLRAFHTYGGVKNRFSHLGLFTLVEVRIVFSYGAFTIIGGGVKTLFSPGTF